MKRFKFPLPERRAIRFILNLFSASFVLLAVSGCPGGGGALPAPSVQPRTQLQVGDVIETATGKLISMDELIARLSSASIIYVGEIHTSAQDHEVQLQILEKLARGGKCVELGMEMFPVSEQAILDRYVRGDMTEDEFLKETRWDKVWGFPYPLYRGLIDFQKSRHLPVLGLNAPNEVVRKIAHKGLGSLTPAERSQVAREFHLDDPRNSTRLREQFMAHAKDHIKDFESFLEAQLAWEETMAQTLADNLEKLDGKCQIMVVIGKGHINDRLGVPYLTAIRKPHEYKTVAPIPLDYPDATTDPDIADYVVITAKSEAPPRPRLGVTIRPTAPGRGLEIIDILPGTPASASGLRAGDIILSVNGLPVKNAAEIQQALSGDGPLYQILIERNRKEMNISVTIEP